MSVVEYPEESEALPYSVRGCHLERYTDIFRIPKTKRSLATITSATGSLVA